MTPIWDMLMTGVVTLPNYAFIIYLLIYTGKFLIAVISLPVALRLSAELFKQILKYKKIVRTYNEDDDQSQYIAYYTHFKIIYCLLLSIIVYITFTIVCSVNAMYMLALFHELENYSYQHSVHTILYFLMHIKTEYLSNVDFISIPTNNYVMYSIEAFLDLGENAIMLFAGILIYQIICYIKQTNFSFWFWIKIFAIRAVFVLFYKSNLFSPIITKITHFSFVSRTTSDVIISLFLPFPLLRKSFELFENVLLTVMSLVLMRVAFKTIKLKEKENIESELMIEEVGQDHIIKVAIAIQLFKIFTVGYFITAVLISLLNLLECHFIYLLALLNTVHYDLNNFTETQVSIGIIAGLLSFLPTLLYIIFLWRLWFYLGNFLRKNYYRFRREDFTNISKINVQKWDNPHFDKLPNQDKIILAHHLVISLITSLFIAGLCSQFLHIRWAAPITLKPGDYIFMNETKSDLFCDGELEYSLTYTPATYLDPVPYKNRINLKNHSCWESINFYDKPESYYYNQRIEVANISTMDYFDIWLPAGTTFQNISKDIQLDLQFYPLPYPCYILSESFFTQLPDKMCYQYKKSQRESGHKPPYHINETICNENETLCTTGCGVYDIYTIQINKSLELNLKRRVYRGGNSSMMCDLRNISCCDPRNIQLIAYKPEDLYFPQNAHRGSNIGACNFSVVCYYHNWIPVLSSICIFLLSVLYCIGTIILIHRCIK